MKQHLNTLYVLTQGTYVSKDSETIVVRVGDEIRARIPALTIGGVVCFGQVSCSPPLLGFCSEKGITVTYLSEHGRFLARVEGPTRGNVLLRREQYRWADSPDRTREVARSIVAAKIANSRAVVLRSIRDRPGCAGNERLSGAAAALGALLPDLESRADVDSVRGVEGAAAKSYFEAFDDLISQQKEDFRFSGRSRRPPLDRVNALLSFVYTLLLHDYRSAVEAIGLDPAVGFLHRERPGRPSLALDLMEELRPWFADRLVLSLVNLRQLEGANFETAASGAVLLNESGRKTVLAAYQKRKQEEVVHPFLGEKTTVGLVPQLQALLMARRVRGELDDYPSFFWK